MTRELAFTKRVFAALEVTTDRIVDACLPRHRHQGSCVSFNSRQGPPRVQKNVWPIATPPTSTPRTERGWPRTRGITMHFTPDQLLLAQPGRMLLLDHHPTKPSAAAPSFPLPTSLPRSMPTSTAGKNKPHRSPDCGSASREPDGREDVRRQASKVLNKHAGFLTEPSRAPPGSGRPPPWPGRALSSC
jgi:hypothetical protein